MGWLRLRRSRRGPGVFLISIFVSFFLGGWFFDSGLGDCRGWLYGVLRGLALLFLLVEGRTYC